MTLVRPCGLLLLACSFFESVHPLCSSSSGKILATTLQDSEQEVRGQSASSIDKSNESTQHKEGSIWCCFC